MYVNKESMLMKIDGFKYIYKCVICLWLKVISMNLNKFFLVWILIEAVSKSIFGSIGYLAVDWNDYWPYIV